MEKPGYKTTEFWLSMAAVVISALIASGAFSDDGTAMKVVAVAAMILNSLGYTASRSRLKAATKPEAE